jgi:hypothetical protein
VASSNRFFFAHVEKVEILTPVHSCVASSNRFFVACAENVDMEITPTALDFPDASQEFQDTVVDETIPPQAEAQYNSSEFENQEGNVDGDHVIPDSEGPMEPHTGDDADTKGEHEGGVAMNHQSAYLAGGMALLELDAGYCALLCCSPWTKSYSTKGEALLHHFFSILLTFI